MAGEITQWNAQEIARDNPDAQLPDERIVVVHRSDESGTTENLQEYLAAVAPNVWDFEVSGDWPRGAASGEAAQGTSGVVQAIEQGSGTIGYADLSQVREPLRPASIGVGQEFVAPSPEAAAQILSASEETDDPGRFVFTYELNRETEQSGTYPIVLVSYQLACTQYDDQAQGQLVKGFLEYIVSEEGQRAAAENAGSAPISQETRQLVTPAIEAIGGGSGS
jgi:phosphate transport system substrate-binding protein